MASSAEERSGTNRGANLQPQTQSLENLPLELKIAILLLVEPQDLPALALVCKSLLEATQADLVWEHALRKLNICGALKKEEARERDVSYEGRAAYSGIRGREKTCAATLAIKAATTECWCMGVGTLSTTLGGSNLFKGKGRVLTPQQIPGSVIPLPIECSVEASEDEMLWRNGDKISEVAIGQDLVVLNWRGEVTDCRQQGQTVEDEIQNGHHSTALLPFLWKPQNKVPVRKVAANGGHASCVDDNGNVFAWGCNKFGQLGIDSVKDFWVAAPVCVYSSDENPATEVCLGSEHKVVLTHRGDALACGSNNFGQCGAPAIMTRVLVLTQMRYENDGKHEAASVSCGAVNSCIVSRDGFIFLCGENRSGQIFRAPLGTKVYLLCCCGPDVTWVGMPRLDQDPQGGGGIPGTFVVQSACSDASVYALCGNGLVFAWGSGSSGQLGVGGSRRVLKVPSKIPWVKNAKSISAHHSSAAVVTRDGKVFTFGSNKFGQLGHGDTSKRTVGRVVKALRGESVERFHFGEDFALCLTSWSIHSHTKPATPPPKESLQQTERSMIVGGSLDLDEFRYHGEVLSISPNANESFIPFASGMHLSDTTLETLDSEETTPEEEAMNSSKSHLIRQYLKGYGMPIQMRIGNKQFKRVLWGQLKEFKESSETDAWWELPSYLDRNQRRLAHLLAEKIGLAHFSSGEEPHRTLVISKRRLL